MRDAADRSSRIVLGVLLLVYVFNFLDRQIVAILAERIKADLGVSDAQIGFLYGTAFAVFYALFGIPLGRLADTWDRRRLIAIGLSFWSVMTALSGFARSFSELAIARIGVGIGEASATPAAYSMLSDTFPAAKRATVLAIYSSGIYIGAGLGLGVGGLIVDRWDAAFAGSAPPFGFRGWQIAYLAVGLPGLLLALVVARLQEPVRGALDGCITPPARHPFRGFALELRAILPPLTLWNLWLEDRRASLLSANVGVLLALAGAAAALSALLGTPIQWIALAVGLYATFSWAQSLALRDPPSFRLIFGTPTFLYASLAFAFLAFTGYGIGFWTPPLFVRTRGVSISEAGLVLGGTSAAAGWLGTITGGIVADAWRRRSPHGRLYVAMLTALLAPVFFVSMVSVDSLPLAYALNFPGTFASSLWLGAGAATIQDLVLPRMRGTASATYLLIVTLVGLALGPYSIGRLSVAFGDLRLAMLAGLGACVLAILFALLARRGLVLAEATRGERAREAGEPEP